MRVIYWTLQHKDDQAKVTWKSEYQEYCVRFYTKQHGRLNYLPEEDYFTTDRQDAINTANAHVFNNGWVD